MSAYKDFLIGVEELIYEAMEQGADTPEAVYSYVKQHEPRVDLFTVENIIADHNRGEYYSYYS
jgi:phage baseplate assembly protein W